MKLKYFGIATSAQVYKKFMTPKIKNSADIKKNIPNNFSGAVNERQR